MNKKLPNVFVNKIDREINNTQKLYYSDLRGERKEPVNVMKKINDIFSSIHHVYKSHVRITTNNDVIDTFIVGKSNIYLLTLDNKKIRIPDIIDIEKI